MRRFYHDSSANPTDAYSYDVFGTIRSQSGSSANYWLFTGEQRDGQPGVAGGVQRLPSGTWRPLR